ncbi:MAG: GcrA family cell cycle regulator [Brevundimonas sp.]
MTEETNAPKKWTEEEDADLRKLALTSGLSYGEIGKKLGRSKNQVVGRAHRLGIAKLRTAASSNAERFGAKVVTARAKPAQVQLTPQRGGCQWIDGHPMRGEPVLFCEKPATDGKGPWCDEHRARVYVSGLDRKKALKTIAFVGQKSGVGSDTWGLSL